ncbi:molecular chaperone [Erwinia sp. PK3-005]
MRLVKAMLTSLLLTYSSVSLASIQIMSTRVILNAAEKEQTFVIRNVGDSPSLVQLWLSDKNSNEMKIQDNLPLFITPPVGRINVNKRKVFRLFPTDQAIGVLPQDRESMFWINALDVPEQDANSTKKNKLSLAFRTRIKLFYRPENMKGNLIEAAENVTWNKRQTTKGYEITATNNSPFHITLVNMKLMHGDKPVATMPGEMVPPYASKTFLFKVAKPTGASTLEYDYISDLGAFVNVKREL